MRRLWFTLVSAGLSVAPSVGAASGFERPSRTDFSVQEMRRVVEHTGARRPHVSVRAGHSSGLELLTVTDAPCGIPDPSPIARAVIDRTAGGRVVLLWTAPRLERPPCRPSKLGPDTAIARVEASGWAGTKGAMDASLQWRRRGDAFRLTWRVDPPADLTVPTNPVFFVDDETGRVTRGLDKVHSARVRVYPTNPLATPVTAIETLGAVDDAAMHLEGPLFAAANCIEPDSGEGWCYRERTAVPDIDGDFIYPEPNLDGPSDPQDMFAEASGYYHLDKFFGYLQAMGFDQTDCHEQGEVVEIVVNRRSYQGGQWQPSDNAFFTGSCGASTLMMGQGAHDFSYDGDIIYHELTHAVVDRLAGESFGEERRRADALLFDSSAINEGVADFMAAAFTGDPLVAEYAFPTGGRGLDNDFACPRDVTGESHADGQIIGAALWDTWEELGDEFVPVVFDALTMLDEDASFEDVALALVALTGAVLGGEAEARVEEILEARGLVDCPRVVPFDEFGAGGVHEDLGVPRLLEVHSGRLGDIYSPTPAPPLQWAVEMPVDADTATLSFSFVTEYNVAQNLALGVRRGGPITFDYAVEGKQVEVTADTDEVVFGADDGEVSFGADPGSLVHVAMFHLGTGDAATDRSLLLHSFELGFSCSQGEGDCEPPDEDEEETGESGESGGSDDPGGDGGRGGCGCQSPRPPAVGWWGFGLLLLTRRGAGSRRV